MNEKTKREEVEIDLLHILKVLLKRFWIILLAMLLAGGIAFLYAKIAVTPTYESSVQMYVNNSSISLGSASFSISTTEINAARSILNTYIVILKTRGTLERVNDAAGLNYSYGELSKMVSAGSVDNTEIFRVTVVSHDPAESKLIADTIADTLPDRISEIVAGSSVRVVDYPVYGTRSGPSYSRYTLIGLLIGLVASAAVIIVIDLMDTTVRSEEYLTQTYDYPILAVIPDANASHSKGGKYYKGYYKGYGYGYGGQHRNQDRAPKEKE